MNLSQVEAYAKIFQSTITGLGIVVGGIWVYYKFVKGRLFSPKIQLSLSNNVVKADQEQILVTLEVTLKNIGEIQLRPASCRLDVTAFSISGGNLVKHNIPVPDGDNIMPFKNKSRGTYYIDPGECSFRSRHLAISSGYAALAVLVYAVYNRCSTERIFYIDLTEKGKDSKASSE